MNRKLSKISLAVMGSVWVAAASAADLGPQPGVAFYPKTINAGAFEIMPWVGLSVGNNSNVGLSNAVKTSSSFTLLNPNVIIGLPTHGQFYGAKYSGTLGRFSGSGVDNYNDHNFGLMADNVWSARFNSLLNADYVKGHDGRNALLFRNKEIWHSSGFNAMGHYGAKEATGQFELSAGKHYKRYDSNNSGSTQFYNLDKTDLTGTFFYKVAPATRLFVEADQSKFAYLDAASKRLDSTEQRYMLGVTWDATAKTTGSAKIGTMKKKFDLGLLPSGTSTVWDAEIKWSPKTYSVVDLSMHQKANEYGGGTGSYIISRETDLQWTHDWSGYVTTALSLGDATDAFVGSARNDKRQTYGLKAMYGFRTWLRAGLGYTHTRRNSSVPINSYTQDVTMLTLEGSL